MKSLLITMLLAGCAIDPELGTDENLEADESEIIYCPDDNCEPVPQQTAKPDLVPSWSSPCHYIYVSYPRPHWEIGLAIKNAGAAQANLHTARVVFRVAYNNWTSAPNYFQLGGLAPGASAGLRLEVPCANHTAGCEIKLTADYANANAESNESNNTQTWLCPRKPLP